MSTKIAKKIAFLRSRSLNFAIAIVRRSFDQMAIADRDLDREKKIAIDDQKIADHSYLGVSPLPRRTVGRKLEGSNYPFHSSLQPNLDKDLYQFNDRRRQARTCFDKSQLVSLIFIFFFGSFGLLYTIFGGFGGNIRVALYF